MPDAKIDAALGSLLDQLADQDDVEALVFPRAGGTTLQSFLTTESDQGTLEFNVLELAGCIAVRAKKRIILALAAREDVQRVTVNPTFSAGGRYCDPHIS
jgi:hypothetical protein